MSKDLSKRAKEIVAKIQYVTIASVDKDGLPWNAPVFATYDENYNFYWGTHKDSQKAKNIANNSSVFLVIYDSTVPPGTGEGVYIKARANQLADPKEVESIFRLLKARHANYFWDFTAVSIDGPIRLYKAVPEKVWMNDEGHKNGHYIDTRSEINL